MTPSASSTAAHDRGALLVGTACYLFACLFWGLNIPLTSILFRTFDAFFLARRAALLRLVEDAMGKTAQRDMEQTELLGGSEAPSEFELGEQDDLDDVVPDDATAA